MQGVAVLRRRLYNKAWHKTTREDISMHPTIEIFGAAIPTYGLFAAAGILAATGVMLISRKKYGISSDDVVYFVLCALIGGLVGAKLLYIIVELPHLIADPSLWSGVVTGGFVFYGGLVGGALAGFIYARVKKRDFLKLFDAAAPGIAIGQALGRVGCHFAGCCYGMECDGALCVVYPDIAACPAPAGVPLLATQLMEAAFLALLTCGLLLILKHSKTKGRTTGWYFVLYGVWRFVIEFFRSDPRGSVGALSTSQFVSIFLVIAGIVLILWKYKKNTQDNEKDAVA